MDATGVLYTGGQTVVLGSSFTPAAKLSSPASTCLGGQTVTFTLDANPLTGVAGNYPLAAAVTNSAGTASAAAVSTSGWIEGAYL